MIKFTDPIAYGMDSSTTYTRFIFPEVVCGFIVKENYKGQCNVVMWGKESLEWNLGNFPSIKTATNFVNAIWNMISHTEKSIIDLDRLRKEVSCGQD